MYKNFKMALILVLSGEGNRFNSDKPKQFHNLSGKRIYLHSLDAFYNLGVFDEIILVSHRDWSDIVKKETSNYENVKVVTGGKTRQESSYSGLKECQNPDYVIFHDAVRPFVTKKIILDNLDAVIKYNAVDTCIKSTDTLVQIDEDNKIARIPNRSHLLRGQTPQSFDYNLILNAHMDATKNKTQVTDDCGLVINRTKIHVVNGDENNIKITNKSDLFLAEHIFRLQHNNLSSTNNKNSLKNKVYAIVGASGGIGKEVVKLLKEGNAIALEISRSSEYKTNLEDFKSIEKTFDEIHKKYGPISGLINTAGLFLVKPFATHSQEEIDKLIKVNLSGLIHSCKEVKIQDKGHIINISSSSYYMGRKNYGVYSATKAAVVNFTQSLAEENPQLQINAIVPQRTNTPMRKKCFPREDQNLLLDPKEVAKAIITLLKDTSITGSIIEVKKK